MKTLPCDLELLSLGSQNKISEARFMNKYLTLKIKLALEKKWVLSIYRQVSFVDVTLSSVHTAFLGKKVPRCASLT